jgi:two-component system phosphate regulon sensor histidine kinase PhoR
MLRRRLLWQIYLSILVLTVVSLAVTAWYATYSLKRFYVDSAVEDLSARVELLNREFAEALSTDNGARVDALCKELGRAGSTRITVVDPSGRVLGDTDADPASMENHGDRPEIIEAFHGRLGRIERYSPTLGHAMVYVAIPLGPKDRPVAVLRTSRSLASVEHELRAIYAQIALGGLVIAVLAALVALGISRRISRPLEEIRRGAEAFGRGDLKGRLPVPRSQEMAELSQVMNRMAAQLDERIRAVTAQRNELEAVLSSMAEAVLAVDAEERVIRLNDAAARLFGVEPDQAQGRSIQEVVRNIDLQRLVTRTLARSSPVEGEVLVEGREERFLQAHGTRLADAQGRGIGALVVLNDVTRLRRLETIRRDFVANVSHELRTPVTSIKGFIETLRDGAVNDPETAKRFLDIAYNHANRLNSIIEDLLSLSRIEQETEKAQVALEPGLVCETLESAILVCREKADEKKIAVELACRPDLRAKINRPLLEQAVVNLVDNAVKYSDPEKTVRVEATGTPSEVVITVRDEGCGIEAEHLPRIFERFYRIDKARSRKLGGTGLGLSIVNHIAQAHGGSVSVESVVGKGSTFTLRLPNA